MAFLKLALPHLLFMSGRRQPPFPNIKAKLKTTVKGDIDWTQFIHACLSQNRDGLSVKPLFPRSRLQSMAQKDALIMIPEGIDRIEAGEWIEAQVLTLDNRFSYIY